MSELNFDLLTIAKGRQGPLSSHNKLREVEAAEIIRRSYDPEYKWGWKKAAAREFGVSIRTVNAIVNGYRWGYLHKALIENGVLPKKNPKPPIRNGRKYMERNESGQFAG